MEHKHCNCKKGGHGHNFVPGRLTVTFDGKEITNRDLACRDCAYKKRGETGACLRFEEKPAAVLEGGACESYLKDGADLGKSHGHSCSSCVDCRDCGDSCGDCGDSCGDGCSSCGGCKGH